MRPIPEKAGDSRWQRLKSWARTMKRDVMALYLAGRDPRVPWHAKAMALATAAYAFSPIDLIPDFVPVLGYVDDLIILPILIWLTVRLVPADVMMELRGEADRRLSDGRPRSAAGAVFIGLIWLSAAALVRRTFGRKAQTSPSTKPTAGFAEFAEFGRPVYQKFFCSYLYKNFPKSAFETQQTQQACLPPKHPSATLEAGITLKRRGDPVPPLGVTTSFGGVTGEKSVHERTMCALSGHP